MKEYKLSHHVMKVHQKHDVENCMVEEDGVHDFTCTVKEFAKMM